MLYLLRTPQKQKDENTQVGQLVFFVEHIADFQGPLGGRTRFWRADPVGLHRREPPLARRVCSLHHRACLLHARRDVVGSFRNRREDCSRRELDPNDHVANGVPQPADLRRLRRLGPLGSDGWAAALVAASPGRRGLPGCWVRPKIWSTEQQLRSISHTSCRMGIPVRG